MSSSESGTRLRGRRRECAALDRLLDEVRAGQSAVLVLRGEPGVGKSALVDYVRTQAAGCRVAEVSGVESEMELAFAGLHQLCAPMLDLLQYLPDPQRDALRVAFGLREGGPPARFLIGLAVLTLLSEAAMQQPLACLVDDAQWLDRASLQVLAFVARRLQADPVALVFAAREPGDDRELVGLPELPVKGIGDQDARLLLASALPGRLDERLRDRIVAESRGNPLALLELSRASEPEVLAGGFGFATAQPLASRIEQSFVGRLRSLPQQTRQLVLAAAAEPLGDASLLWRAADQLGIGSDAAAPAEDAGLIELGVRVRFRHPLVRRAAYWSASVPERQQVHRALAEAIDAQADPDRRAWHRARAASGIDEVVAYELEHSADRARSRGGVAAAAAFLTRAAALTADPARRGARALAAAEAALDAGSPDTASEMLETAELGRLDEIEHAQVERLRAQVALAVNRGREAPPLLLKAAERLGPLDAALARQTLLDALGAAMLAGRLGDWVLQAAEAARSAPRVPGPERPIDLLLDGLASRFTDGYAAGVPPLQRAVQAFRRADPGTEGHSRWLWLACRAAPEVWDDEAWLELSTREVALAREAGALTVLPFATNYRANIHVHAGEFAAAAALIDEAEAITEATGNPPIAYTSLLLAAWRGREFEVAEAIQAGTGDAAVRGEGRVLALAEYSSAVLNNGRGRYDAALAAARQAADHDDLSLFGWALTELVEAGVRSGRSILAHDALRRLGEQTRAAGTDWALGIEARSRALLSDGAAAEDLYREAVARLARTRIPVHLARAHLLYGEWLRRANRRLDARDQLRRAYDMFAGFGAGAFAERARRELLAVGEAAHTPAPDTPAVLTAQEAQIARLARDGYTNPEIGAQLFLSPRTVEWHLRKVFTKLGITSRRELRQALPGPGHGQTTASA